MDDHLRSYVEKITRLPTVPAVAQEIIKLAGDDLVSVGKIEKIIENDPAISAKVLSVANSAYLGFKSPAKTLNSAIMRVGFDNVKNIAVGVSLMTVMENGGSGQALDYQRVFNHSVTVGFIASLISKDFKTGLSESIIMDGILHDIGYLILSRYFSDTYKEVLRNRSKENSLLESEKTILNFTHADIGSWLVEKWNLPHTILDSTLYHHTPSLARRNIKRVAVIHIADYLAAARVMSPVKQDPNYELDPAALEILGVTDSDMKDVEKKVCGETASEEGPGNVTGPDNAGA